MIVTDPNSFKFPTDPNDTTLVLKCGLYRPDLKFKKFDQIVIDGGSLVCKSIKAGVVKVRGGTLTADLIEAEQLTAEQATLDVKGNVGFLDLFDTNYSGKNGWAINVEVAAALRNSTVIYTDVPINSVHFYGLEGPNIIATNCKFYVASLDEVTQVHTHPDAQGHGSYTKGRGSYFYVIASGQYPMTNKAMADGFLYECQATGSKDVVLNSGQLTVSGGVLPQINVWNSAYGTSTLTVNDGAVVRKIKNAGGVVTIVDGRVTE